MKTVRDACKLQENALSIKLSDQVERLDELIEVEGDGADFFKKTHITQGMQDLISEGIARLAGRSSQAVFHLKQAMGGGKTHLLVGFGLLARSAKLRKTYCGGMTYASVFGSAAIAAFNGRNNPDHFFWGEIANQLGKGDQFKTFWTGGPKAPDEKDWLKIFEGDRPVLILLDEMPPYFHYLDTQKVGNGTVADIATRAFANLLTAAGKKKNVCVVVSDLAAAYDTGAKLINRALEDARAELGRQERNITPVDLAANEIYDILRKRLFESLPDKAEIEDIADAFGRKLEEASKSKTASRGAEAIADEIAATYPFHPRLKNNPYTTTALRVSFLVCDVSAQYETGDPVTWTNRLVLRNRLSEKGSKRSVELFVAPRGAIRYTLDGSEPREGTPYEGPIPLGDDARLPSTWACGPRPRGGTWTHRSGCGWPSKPARWSSPSGTGRTL
jgi:hypothetical protein